MQDRRGSLVLCLIVALSLAGCGPAADSQTVARPAEREVATGPSVLTAAILNQPIGMVDALAGGPGSDALERLVNAGLVAPDNRSVLQPELAEAVPSLANGLWTLLPDGGMQTTWKLKPNVRWHDGQPFTADDVLFTAQLGRDRDLPFYNVGFGLMTSVAAPDPLTVVVQCSSCSWRGMSWHRSRSP